MKNNRFSKDFNGKVKRTKANIYKMNFREYFYYKNFVWGYDILDFYLDMFKDLWEGIKTLFLIIINTILIIFFPITIPVFTYHCYRKSMKEKKKMCYEK